MKNVVRKVAGAGVLAVLTFAIAGAFMAVFFALFPAENYDPSAEVSVPVVLAGMAIALLFGGALVAVSAVTANFAMDQLEKVNAAPWQ